MANLLAWIQAHPVTFIAYLVTVGSTVLAVLRVVLPGSRVTAGFSTVFVDVVKIACLALGVPLPGGFSPAPAVIPPTPEAAQKQARLASTPSVTVKP